MKKHQKRSTASRHPAGFVRGRGIIIYLLGCLVLLALMRYVYGPALQLPRSMIDEATHIINAHKLWENLGSRSLQETLRQDVSSQLRTYNPVFWFHSALLYRITGESRYAYHFILLLELLITLGVLIALPAARGMRGWAAASGGLLSAVILLLTEVPGWHGMQCIRANWIRLHTADAPASLLLSVNFFFMCLLFREAAVATVDAREWRRWIFAAAAATCIAISALMKPVFGALFGPMIGIAILAAIAGNRNWKPILACALAGLAVVALHALLLKTLLSGSSVAKSYGSGYTLTSAAIRNGVSFWTQSYLDALGPLLIFALSGSAYLIAQSWALDGSVRVALRANCYVLYVLLCWLTVTAAYVPWVHLLPRYMITGVTCMAALTGCVSARLLDQLRSCKLSAGRVVVWGGAGVICILVLKLSLLCGVLVIAAAYALYRRKQESVSVLLCGILVAGTIYLVVFGMASAGSLHADYIAQEHLQEEVMEKCISYGRQNRTIGVIGDASDERFGSTQYFAEQEGSHLQFRSVKSTPDLQQVDLLLRIPNEGSPFSLERSLPLTRIASLGGTVTIDEPVSYWTWRRNLWHGKLEYLTDTKLDRLWIFYGPDAKRARMKSKGR